MPRLAPDPAAPRHAARSGSAGPVDSLRRRLRNLVTSGGLLLGSTRMAPGCCPPMDDPTARDRLIDPRGAYALAVAECRADDLACTKLCVQVFFDGALPADTGILGCVLRDRTPTESLVHVEYLTYVECSAGRRPPGLRATTPVAAAAVGRWLAAAAHLEAASVPAFALLAEELALHGAPLALVRAALAAADDEVRHAAVLGALARAHGAEPPAVELAPPSLRGLADLAIDNAIEGCVREAFAARCAAVQARTAADPRVRAAMATIAVDEARHAALARAIDAWASARIGAATRAACGRARRRAVDELWVGTELPPAGADAIGWPPPPAARAVLRALAA
jgi:hypothetical protein